MACESCYKCIYTAKAKPFPTTRKHLHGSFFFLYCGKNPYCEIYPVKKFLRAQQSLFKLQALCLHEGKVREFVGSKTTLK